jgi:hydrogenase maturation protease
LKSSEKTVHPALKSDIKERIKGPAAIVGIGNILRADDGFGPKLIELLRSKGVKTALFDCGTAPENYIFPIISSSCDTVILVDTANLGIAPGGIRVLGPDAIANVSFSTHNPSPRLFIDLLRTGRDNLNIFIVAVQPKTTSFGENLSEEVRRGLSALADAFAEVLAQ